MFIIEHRRLNNGYECPTITQRNIPLYEVLWTFLYFELGYGGQLVANNPCSVTTITNIFYYVDTTVFASDNPEEVKLLLSAAEKYLAYKSAYRAAPSTASLTAAGIIEQMGYHVDTLTYSPSTLDFVGKIYCHTLGLSYKQLLIVEELYTDSNEDPAITISSIVDLVAQDYSKEEIARIAF